VGWTFSLGEMKMRNLLFAVFVFFSLADHSAQCETISVDISDLAGFQFYNVSNYLTEAISPVYSFAAGDVVDFGAATVQSLQTPAPRDFNCVMGNGCFYIAPTIQIFLGGTLATFNSLPISTYVCAINCTETASEPLVVSFGDGGGEVQFGFVGSLQISSPFASAVPEPSTWAMLLIGFAGIGFASSHRKSKPSLDGRLSALAGNVG
jgi:hypothetical protein